MARKSHKGQAETEKVTKLKAKRHDVIVEALQLVLDYGDHYELDQHTKDGLAAAVGRMAPPEKWGFVMLNPAQQRAVLKAIMDGPKPLQTIAAWNACISFIAYDRNGEIAAARNQIAEAANLTPQNTSTAMTRLVTLGVLTRVARGRFKVNPYVAWSGPLHKREIAAMDQEPVRPKLTVIDGGKPEPEVAYDPLLILAPRVVEYLRTADTATRDRWARRAGDLRPLPNAPLVEDLNDIPRWAYRIAEEMVEEGLISGELEG
jgi:hypothetical protein